MNRAAFGMLALALALLLAGCGKVGPVRAPGPPSEITYPRPYPAPDPVPARAPAAAPPAGAATPVR